MNRCTSCNHLISDGEPFCPLCGPEGGLEIVDGESRRAPYSPRPRKISLRLKSLIVFDKHIFFFLTSAIIVVSSILLLFDLSTNQMITWSRYPMAALMTLWVTLVLPYAFRVFYGFTYLLLSALAVSSFLMFLDLQDGICSWAFIPSLILLIPALANYLYFSLKRIFTPY